MAHRILDFNAAYAVPSPVHLPEERVTYHTINDVSSKIIEIFDVVKSTKPKKNDIKTKLVDAFKSSNMHS